VRSFEACSPPWHCLYSSVSARAGKQPICTLKTACSGWLSHPSSGAQTSTQRGAAPEAPGLEPRPQRGGLGLPAPFPPPTSLPSPPGFLPPLSLSPLLVTSFVSCFSAGSASAGGPASVQMGRCFGARRHEGDFCCTRQRCLAARASVSRCQAPAPTGDPHCSFVLPAERLCSPAARAW